MTLSIWDEIIESTKDLETYEKRSRTSDYLELVFINKDAPQWTDRLGVHLGPPLKPAGSRPCAQAKQLSQARGGIRPEQTMFFKAFDDFSIVAMFWPWGDNQLSTLKMWLTRNS